MNVVDAIIVILVIVSLMVGANFGLVLQLFASAGTLIGLHLAALISSYLMIVTDSSNGRLAIIICITLLIIALGMNLGLSVGAQLNNKLEHLRKLHRLELVNKGLGMVVGAVAVIFFAWLSGAILANSSNTFVATQVRTSTLLSSLNTNWPPPADAIAYARHAIQPFEIPQIFIGTEPIVSATSPGPLSDSMHVTTIRAAESVVKVEGQACGSSSIGSGFVAHDHLVVTNAHVVASIREPFVKNRLGTYAASVVYFDPNLDIAVLRAPTLTAKPLPIKDAVQPNGTSGAIIGFPDGGDISYSKAIVRDTFQAEGYDIYDRDRVSRAIYAINARVVSGDSGGPLLDESGAVIGLVFGHAIERPNIGYALTMEPISRGVDTAIRQNGPVSTGTCNG